MARQAPVGNDLKRVLGHQQVDQHAVVVFGVPHAVLAEEHQCAFPRSGVAAQVAPGQPRLGHDANLPGVLQLAGRHLCAQALQRGCRDGGPANGVMPAVVHQPPEGSPQRVRRSFAVLNTYHQSPQAPPPPKSPPPPDLKPPLSLLLLNPPELPLLQPPEPPPPCPRLMGPLLPPNSQV